ncbi:GNAT family N-acetyltransferase [Streptomyces sp. NPDC093097]|uniref:GNAT family N-acetyltransferase n=1 Tax=Streptomyces sp. NPDC093097 TaxID=3366027 RepID=UPI003818A4C2
MSAVLAAVHDVGEGELFAAVPAAQQLVLPSLARTGIHLEKSMSAGLNAYGQPVGPPLPDWTARPAPARVTLEGRLCRVEPLDADRHADDLYAAYALAADGSDWTYMTSGPFEDPADYRAYVTAATQVDDPLEYAVVDLRTGRAVGTLSLMRQDPSDGVVEVGSVAFSPLLKQTPVSTEAQFLLMSYAFDELGYRRYEWKCDSLNAPSRKAALRLGFAFEGIFRQAMVYKGRSRDTAWYSVIDSEWPRVGKALREWLSPDNFDAEGRQKRSLSIVRAADEEPGH